MSEEMVNTDQEQRQLAYFVGGEYQRYLTKWAPMLHGQAKRAGWNWAGFFLGGLWMGYRKMYGATIAYYAALIVLLALDEVVGGSALTSVVGLGVGVAIGLYGNAWYLKHAQTKIAEVRSQGGDDETQLRELTRLGGTSMAATLGLALLYLLGVGLVFGAYATFGSAY